MHTLVIIASVVIGILGLALLIFQPVIGIAFIVIGLLLYVGNGNATKRAKEQEWRDQMLRK